MILNSPHPNKDEDESSELQSFQNDPLDYFTAIRSRPIYPQSVRPASGLLPLSLSLRPCPKRRSPRGSDFKTGVNISGKCRATQRESDCCSWLFFPVKRERRESGYSTPLTTPHLRPLSISLFLSLRIPSVSFYGRHAVILTSSNASK